MEDLDDMIEDLKNISTCQDEENDENFREKNNLDSSPSNFFWRGKCVQ